MVVVRVEKVHHEAQNVDSKKAVNDAGVELATVIEALRVLEGKTSTIRSAMHSVIEERDPEQFELGTNSAKLKLQEKFLLLRLTT